MTDQKEEFGHELPTFVARMWLERGPDRTVVWRGRVKHVQSDREAYFRSFEQLATFLTEISGVPGPVNHFTAES
jgi:hypothetical protein